MNRQLITHPLFRLIAPILVGLLCYLLVLLINNNVYQLRDEFLGRELYFCIGLAFLVFEGIRLTLLISGKFGHKLNRRNKALLKSVLSLSVVVLFVSGSLWLYFIQAIGYPPERDEILFFNLVYIAFGLLYLLLYFSIEFLNHRKTDKESIELERVEEARNAYLSFVHEMNPTLLFECLEHLIYLIHKDTDQADAFVGSMARVYRYALGERTSELVPLNREIDGCMDFIRLMRAMPYTSVELKVKGEIMGFILPCVLQKTLERIVRSIIPVKGETLEVYLHIEKKRMVCTYAPRDRITDPFDMEYFKTLDERYQVYTRDHVLVNMKGEMREIILPNLQMVDKK